MQQRLPSLFETPIVFAHRGARAVAADNTMEAFDLAAEMGATGLETDAWLTSDRIPVLDHDGAVRQGRLGRRTPIANLERSALPDHIPTFGELFRRHGTSLDLSVDLKDPDVGGVIIDEVRNDDPTRLAHLWLCEPDADRLAVIRSIDQAVRVVHSTRLDRLDRSPEAWAAHLSETGIDAINMRQPDWNGGLVTLFHRFGVAAFMWDVQTEYELVEALRMGVDAVYSDHVDRAVRAQRVVDGAAG